MFLLVIDIICRNLFNGFSLYIFLLLYFKLTERIGKILKDLEKFVYYKQTVIDFNFKYDLLIFFFILIFNRVIDNKFIEHTMQHRVIFLRGCGIHRIYHKMIVMKMNYIIFMKHELYGI